MMSSHFNQICQLKFFQSCHSKAMISNKKIFLCESKIRLSLKYTSLILQCVLLSLDYHFKCVHDYINSLNEGGLSEAWRFSFSLTLVKFPKHKKKLCAI